MTEPHQPTRLTIRSRQIEQQDGSEAVRIELQVPEDLLWFEGHFDGDSILAAVVQIREVVCFVNTTWPELRQLRRIKRAKFRRPIRPADLLTLRLVRPLEGVRVTFEFSREQEVCSSGGLEFE